MLLQRRNTQSIYGSVPLPPSVLRRRYSSTANSSNKQTLRMSPQNSTYTRSCCYNEETHNHSTVLFPSHRPFSGEGIAVPPTQATNKIFVCLLRTALTPGHAATTKKHTITLRFCSPPTVRSQAKV